MKELWGSTLKTLRESRGMTQDELAEKMKIPVDEIAALEEAAEAVFSGQAAQLIDCLERDSDIPLPPEVLRQEEQLLLNQVRTFSRQEQRRILQYLEELSRLPKDEQQK